jgi:putative ABC transport system permease protein
MTGIIYNNYNFINIIPNEIYLYPSNYDNKLLVLNKLNEYNDIKYQDISTSIKSISNNLIDAISIILIVFSIITLIVSSILISILTYINIMEYKHEIGIYKSIGMSNNNIKLIFYLENIFIVIKSIIISISFIDISSIIFNRLIYRSTGLTDVIALNLPIVLIISIISVFLSIISSYIPIKNISKLNIVDILRYE